MTIKLERIFIDKIFAAEFYYRKLKDSTLDVENRSNAAFDVAKHVYDLIVLFNSHKIKTLLSNAILLKELIEFKRQEEEVRVGGIEASLKINDFLYLDEIYEDTEFLTAYEKMQNIYVFNDKDKLPLDKALKVIEAIKAINE